MSAVGSDDARAVFVFDPDANYSLVREIRDAGVMPTRGLRYVAAVTGPWKIFKVMVFGRLDEDLTEELVDVAERLDAPGDPETATSLFAARLRRSTYRRHTALVRIETSVPDPSELIDRIGAAIEAPAGDQVEADVVAGAFDILACVVDDDEERLGAKIMNIRRIDGVTRTTSLRVIDYVSTSPNAPADHRVEPASG
jgi:hypothetical protein